MSGRGFVYASFGAGGNASSSSSEVSSGRPAAETSHTALSVNQIYRLASGGVVEITTTTGSQGAVPFGGSGVQQAQPAIAAQTTS